MVIAGIVAGGKGTRMSAAGSGACSYETHGSGACALAQGSLPKQFMEIGGRPIIIHTIERFLDSPDIDAVIIGVNADWEDYLKSLLKESGRGRLYVVTGGVDRADTLNRIIEDAAARWTLTDADIFVTHDAVRPFVTEDIIRENVLAAGEFGVCGTAVAATDTILHSSDGHFITDIPSRSEMFQAQTPQSFRYGAYREAYGSLTAEEKNRLTDACGMFYLKGYDVRMVPGDVRNFKITYPQDLVTAESLLRQQVPLAVHT